MHFRLATALAGLVAASAALAQVCPVVTKTEIARSCNKRCGDGDCQLVTTVRNPCGCPADVPTATLIAPCQAECPYGGCGLEVRTLNEACRPTSSSSTRRPTTTPRSTFTTRRPPTTSSTRRPPTSTTAPPSVSWGITVLPTMTPTPTIPSPVECPTITQVTRPNGCPVIRCPVPNCIQQSELVLPCGCSGPRTLLYVQGCQTACPEGCMTRTQTVSRAC